MKSKSRYERAALMLAGIALTLGVRAVDVTTADGTGFDGYFSEAAAASGTFTLDDGNNRNWCYRTATANQFTVLKFDLSAVTIDPANVGNVQLRFLVVSSTGSFVRLRGLHLYTGDDSLITSTGLVYDAANPLIVGTYTPDGNFGADFDPATVTQITTFNNVAQDNYQSITNAALTTAVINALNGDKTITLLLDGGDRWLLTREGETATVGDRPTLIIPDAGDQDNDNLPDGWETGWAAISNLTQLTGLASGPGPGDGTGDWDNDGYSDLQEFQANSDPTNSASVPGDIDGDGLADLWEDKWFGNNDGIILATELALQDGTGDPDGDGYTNEQEESGVPLPSNPKNINSVPGNTDGDTLDDTWELSNFGDVTLWNGLHDPDGDLCTNEEEETAMTDPTNLYDYIEDADGDGQNDRYEIKYFGSITINNDPFSDPDGDGFDNDYEYGEFVYGDGNSDPNNINSTPDDKDGDLLDDMFEKTNFNNSIWDYDGNDDPDGDFATNEEEETGGTNPTVRTSAPDTDNGGAGDGLGDAWELYSFGDLTTTESGTNDSDGDGVTDAAEFAAGTNGNNPLSGPDGDNDGLPDVLEIALWGSVATQNGSDDSDGGGTPNLVEVRLGTNPSVMADDITPPALTTAIGKGADTFITNDSNTGPGVTHGTGTGIELRVNYGTRIRVPVLRFDVSALTGDLTNTMLRLNLTGSPRSRTWAVWGLVDGDSGENWDEAATNFFNVPGLDPAEQLDADIAQFPRDPRRLRLLGTLQAYQNQLGTLVSNPLRLDLKSFIEEDTDGVITLMLSNGNENFSWYFPTKEGNPALAAALVVPNGTVLTVPEITGMGFVGGNPANDFFIDVADGVAGKKVTSSDNLSDPFVDVSTTNDGANRFFISPANRNAMSDFFRVENQ